MTNEENRKRIASVAMVALFILCMLGALAASLGRAIAQDRPAQEKPSAAETELQGRLAMIRFQRDDAHDQIALLRLELQKREACKPAPPGPDPQAK